MPNPQEAGEKLEKSLILLENLNLFYGCPVSHPKRDERSERKPIPFGVDL